MPIIHETGDGPDARRRTRSVPPKYMMPSEHVGQYESKEPRKRTTSTTSGLLYPLDEQGSYGAAPTTTNAEAGIPFHRIRERKPKVYSSYSVDSGCQMHAKKLATAQEEGIRSRHSSGYASSSSSSAAPTPRSSVSRTTSLSEPQTSRRHSSSEPTTMMTFNSRKFGHSYDTGSGRRRTSSNRSGGHGHRNVSESSIDEREELAYNNTIINGSSSPPVGLNGMRKPKIDSWDSMGILGLTTKIWNDTKKRQETFMESTGHLLREETSSYMM